MASGLIGNEVPRKGLRVRIPCPPLHGQVGPPRDVLGVKFDAASPSRLNTRQVDQSSPSRPILAKQANLRQVHRSRTVHHLRPRVPR